MTRQFALSILAAMILANYAQASVLYNPGDAIPNNSFSATGIFRNLRVPSGDDASAIGANVSGLNSPELTFWYPFDNGFEPNSLRFQGVVNTITEFPDLLTGEPFLAGYLVYDNGLWFSGESRSEIFLQTFSPNISGATQTLVENALVIATPNNDDPEQSADIVYFEGRPDLGSLRVYEGEIAAIEVWGRIGSLHLDAFGDVVSDPGSGFYFSGVDQVDADYVPDATGNGVFSPTDTAAVPEPATFAIWSAFAAIGLVAAARGRKNK